MISAQATKIARSVELNSAIIEVLIVRELDRQGVRHDVLLNREPARYYLELLGLPESSARAFIQKQIKNKVDYFDTASLAAHVQAVRDTKRQAQQRKKVIAQALRWAEGRGFSEEMSLDDSSRLGMVTAYRDKVDRAKQHRDNARQSSSAMVVRNQTRLAQHAEQDADRIADRIVQLRWNVEEDPDLLFDRFLRENYPSPAAQARVRASLMTTTLGTNGPPRWHKIYDKMKAGATLAPDMARAPGMVLKGEFIPEEWATPEGLVFLGWLRRHAKLDASEPDPAYIPLRAGAPFDERASVAVMNAQRVPLGYGSRTHDKVREFVQQAREEMSYLPYSAAHVEQRIEREIGKALTRAGLQ